MEHFTSPSLPWRSFLATRAGRLGSASAPARTPTCSYRLFLTPLRSGVTGETELSTTSRPSGLWRSPDAGSLAAADDESGPDGGLTLLPLALLWATPSRVVVVLLLLVVEVESGPTADRLEVGDAEDGGLDETFTVDDFIASRFVDGIGGFVFRLRADPPFGVEAAEVPVKDGFIPAFKVSSCLVAVFIASRP